MSAEDIDILERRTAYDGFFRIDVCRLRYRLYDGGWSEARKGCRIIRNRAGSGA